MGLIEVDLYGKKVYVDDDIDEKETGVYIDDDLENTEELQTINEDTLLENTQTDIFGEDEYE